MRLRSLAMLAQRLVPRTRDGALVLAYHLVGARVSSPVNLARDAFERQLDHLCRHFEVVTLTEALRRAGQAREKPLVVLTFDDAYLNFAEVAWPALRERRLPCTLYAPVGFVRGDARPPLTGANLPACTFDDLRKLRDEGVEIGSHGVNHVNLRRADAAKRLEEVATSRQVLERELGSRISSFCYAQAKHDEASVALVRQHYDNAVTAGGLRYRGGDLHRVPRFPVRSDETAFDRMLRSRVWLPEAFAHQLRQLRA